MSDVRRGVGFGIAAYLLWGITPLYWPLLKPSSAVEILAHRLIWSLVAVIAILAARRHWGWIRKLARQPKRLGLLVLAAVIISVNWGTYIYAVNTDRTIEAALGYFTNPLISVLAGVIVFRERLRPWQTAAVGLGTVAVVVLTVDYGRLPWISLVLACSFATYATLKKFAAIGSAEGLTIETLAMLGPALAYVLTLQASGDGTFTSSFGHAVLLAGAGVTTAVPLMLFNSAAIRLPMTYVGMLQYIAPVMQFLIGWLVFREAMPGSRWIGFMLVWAALVVLSADSLRSAHRTRLAARLAPPVREPA